MSANDAFILVANDFGMSTVTSVRGVGGIGGVKIINLQSPFSSLIRNKAVLMTFFVDGLDENGGPQIRKLYASLNKAIIRMEIE